MDDNSSNSGKKEAGVSSPSSSVEGQEGHCGQEPALALCWARRGHP